MRKFGIKPSRDDPGQILQCGRIYKDAEIQTKRRLWRPAPDLQCGRIYKDAEIDMIFSEARANRDLQCGRIYKDAEIAGDARRVAEFWMPFNVAASIKMRKSVPMRRMPSRVRVPSMWPHL